MLPHQEVKLKDEEARSLVRRIFSGVKFRLEGKI